VSVWLRNAHDSICIKWGTIYRETRRRERPAHGGARNKRGRRGYPLRPLPSSSVKTRVRRHERCQDRGIKRRGGETRHRLLRALAKKSLKGNPKRTGDPQKHIHCPLRSGQRGPHSSADCVNLHETESARIWNKEGSGGVICVRTAKGSTLFHIKSATGTPG